MKYQKSHPWLTFDWDPKTLEASDWAKLCLCAEKSEQVAQLPLPATVRAEFEQTYLVKGIKASTAIEGNILSEQQVSLLVTAERTKSAPRDQQQLEVWNYLQTVRTVNRQQASGSDELSSDLINEYNYQVLQGLALSDQIEPGKIRRVPVRVGRYQGAPAVECRYLLERLSDWLPNIEVDVTGLPHLWLVRGLLQGLIAHLYLALIHPYGDGNGRTARILELRILLEAGFPGIVAHLLAKHYYRTQSNYYLALEERSLGPPYTPNYFIHYAVNGLLFELSDQAERIRHFVVGLIWTEHVRGFFVDQPTSKTSQRQMTLVLNLPLYENTLIADLPMFNAELQKIYGDLGARTLSRDVQRLVEADLLVRTGNHVRPKSEVLNQFSGIEPQSLPTPNLWKPNGG